MNFNIFTVARAVEVRVYPGVRMTGAPVHRTLSIFYGQQVTHKSSRRPRRCNTRRAIREDPACESPLQTIEPRDRGAAKAVSSTLRPVGIGNRIRSAGR